MQQLERFRVIIGRAAAALQPRNMRALLASVPQMFPEQGGDAQGFSWWFQAT